MLKQDKTFEVAAARSADHPRIDGAIRLNLEGAKIDLMPI
jgi:hypothetical protein